MRTLPTTTTDTTTTTILTTPTTTTTTTTTTTATGHPNVNTLLDALEDGECYYLVLPYLAHGDLFDYIDTNAKNGMSTSEARSIFSQVIGKGFRVYRLIAWLIDLGSNRKMTTVAIKSHFGVMSLFLSVIGFSMTTTLHDYHHHDDATSLQLFILFHDLLTPPFALPATATVLPEHHNYYHQL